MSEAVAAPAAPAAPTPSAAPSTPAAPANPTKGASIPAPASSLSASDASPAAKPETAAEKRARILKGKVDGKEVEWNLDEMKDEDLATELQMAKAARLRMQESANVRKQFQEFLEAFKKDPFSVAKDPVFGVDLEALAEKRLAEKYREQTLPEPERKALELQRQAEAYKRQLAEFQQREQQRKTAEQDKQAEAEVRRDFEAAVKASGLPFNDSTLVLMAEEAHTALSDGLELAPAQLAARVNKKLKDIHGHVTKDLKGEALLGFLGDSTVKEVLRAALEKVKGKKTAAPAAAPAADPRAKDEYAQKPGESYAAWKRRVFG